MTLVAEPAATGRTVRPTLHRPRAGIIGVGVILTLLVLGGVWSIIDLRINVASMISSYSNAADFVSRMWPLDFPPVGEIVSMTVMTLAIVLCATVLSVLLSTGVALLAARNTNSHPVIRYAARAAIVIARALPEVVLVLIFIRMFGIGTVAGILAMGIQSVGMVGKMYADAIEDTDEGPRSALRAAGAGWWQQISGSVLPQVAPAFVATALHRFDINLRTSVVLGYVGVAGIGMELSEALRTLDYQRGMALALFVVALCIVVELISGTIRTALLGRRRGGGLFAWVRAPRSSEPASVRVRGGRVRSTPPWTLRRIRGFSYVVFVLLLIALAVVHVDVNVSLLFDGVANLPRTLGLLFPPSTGGIFGELLDQLLVTVQIALAGTLIGAVLALPLGALAARNVTPWPRLATACRVFIVCVRGVPELIIAIIFVVITGLGATAGALALAIGAIGLLGKLVADSLEETDVRVQEALSASGATRSQVFFGATIRQAAPAAIAHILYQLDANVRAATLLGVVGAGGIGFNLLNAARVMQFDVVTTIVVMVFAVVMAVEAISMWVRAQLA